MKRLVQICAIMLFCTFPCMAQTQHDRIAGRGTSTFDTYKNTATVVITGTTPSVATGNVFKTNNGTATTITNFLGGTDSQQIVILCGESNTIIANNSNISIAGGVNFDCVVNTGIAFVYDGSQSKWIENGGTGTGSGGGGSPGAPTQSLQCNSGAGTFVACNATDNGTTLAIGENSTVAGNQSVAGAETITGAASIGGNAIVSGDTQFCGPNPSRDVRCYHARSVNPNIVPAIPGITATVSGTTATLSSASSFQNGDGVDVWGAGSACVLTAPTGVTVTPAIAAAPTGTGIDVVAPAGSTSYAYEVIAVDFPGCYTAASTSGTTTTGSASLGAQSLSITGFTQSGNTVTATVSSTTSLSVGSYVYITTPSTTDAGTFGCIGCLISSIPNGTTFTYVTGQTVAGGAPATSQGGGTLYYWNSNRITWTAVSGAYEYFIYGRTGGSLTLLGQTWVNNPTASFPVNSWDDYGSTMMAGQLFPYWVPTSPPASSLPDPLVTTICSGAGTTTLTLCASAATPVTNQTILFDNGPNILSAAGSGNTLLYFPGGTYVVNANFALPNFTFLKIGGGQLFLNGTIQYPFGRLYGMIDQQALDDGFAS